MTRLTSMRDITPYINRLIAGLRSVLLDPIPVSREAAAKALGRLVPYVGSDTCSGVVSWLLETLVSDTGTVERCGAAQVRQ
mgnify:CR=1 FL=1